jgi:hypothetical protein
VELARNIIHTIPFPAPDYTLAVWGKGKHVDITAGVKKKTNLSLETFMG